MYLLDTNAWIGWLRQNEPNMIRRIERLPVSELRLCSVVVGELVYGAERSGRDHRSGNFALIAQLRETYPSLVFDDQSAEVYGGLRADLAARGQLIGAYDMQIAAIALVNRCTLVTHNTAEFSRVTGLTIEDWQTA